MIFAVNGVDYSANTVSGGYDISAKEKIFGSWEDGNGKTHKVMTYKVSGSIVMYFPTLAAYEAFVTNVVGSQDDEHTNAVTLKVNNRAGVQSIRAFVRFEPVRSIDSAWNDTFGKFTVEIEEQ